LACKLACNAENKKDLSERSEKALFIQTTIYKVAAGNLAAPTFCTDFQCVNSW
jgi:hypothetical protein